MNEIKVEVEIKKSESGFEYTLVSFYIDGNDLVSLLKTHEFSFAEAEGNLELAGSYQAYIFSNHEIEILLGNKTASDKEKFKLLDCNCGNSGCWPLNVKIERNNDVIVWREFEQPYEKKDCWDYSEFGPFAFNLASYKTEILKLKKFSK